MFYWSYLVEVLSCLLWSLLRHFHKPCQIVHLTCPLQTHCLAEKWKIWYFHAYSTCHFILLYWFENNSPEKRSNFEHTSCFVTNPAACWVVLLLLPFQGRRYAHFIVRLSSCRLKGHLLESLSNPSLSNLSKPTCDLEQNVTKAPFSGIIFCALACGVACFVHCNSSNNHFFSG